MQEIWNKATDEKRSLMSAAAPEKALQTISEVEECWAAKEAAKAAKRSDARQMPRLKAQTIWIPACRLYLKYHIYFYCEPA